MTESGLDLGILVIRVSLGIMLLAHGSNKVFGPGGIAGTSGWFEAVGLRPGRLHAVLAAVTEIGAGVLMCAGFLFPLPCAAFVGLMLVAALTDHRGKGFFVFKGGWEYVGLVAAIATGLALVGPGRWSLDRGLNLELAGLGWGLAALLVGLIAGGGLLATFRRPVDA